MTNEHNHVNDLVDLRARAEEIVRQKTEDSQKYNADFTLEEILRTIHELDVYHIELEMQNKALQQAYNEMEVRVAQRTRDLRRIETLLNTTQEMSKIGGWEWDIENHISTWTEGTYRIHDMAADNSGLLSPENMFQSVSCYTPEDHHAITAALGRCCEEGIPYDFEVPFTSVKGRKMWVHTKAEAVWDGDRIVKVVGNIVDITEFKQAEQALRERESRYRALFEAESDAVFLIENATGSILDINSAASALYGYEYSELLEMKNTDLSADPQETHKATTRAQVIPGEIINIPLRFHKKKDGTIFPVEITGRFFLWSGKPLHLAAIRDITERRRNEDVLQAHLRLSNYAAAHTLDEVLQRTIDEAELLTGSNIGFFHSVEKDQNTLLLQAWSTNTINKSCTAEAKQRHYDVEQAGVWVDCLHERRPVIHNDYASLPHRKGMPEGHAFVVRELLMPVIRGDLVVAILGVGNKKQEYIEQDIETLQSLVDQAWDIIERKQAEAALRESEERFRSLFDIMLEGYAYCEGILENGQLIDFVYLEVNSAFEQLLGLNNVIGKRVTEVIPCILEAQPEIFEIYGRVILTGNPEKFEVYVKPLSVWLAICAYSVGNNRFIAMFENITERKKVEQALQKSAERDHHIAEIFQKTVMPSEISIQPTGYEIATKYQPASNEAEVCGDFCDIFDLGQGNIGISIGDIIGKGLLAAMRVTAAKNMIRSYAFLYERPSQVMALVNDALCRDIAMENDMLTAFFAILDTERGILTYSNAGHEPPMLRQSDGKIKLLNVGGPMFCGMGKQVYLEGFLMFKPGDVFVTVTDGITEAGISRTSQQFGTEGIVNCLTSNAGASAEQISSAILASASDFAKGYLRDDASVVVIKKADS